MLAFGCGDLKEADLSQTVRTRGLTRFLALLETETSRRAVEASVGHLGVSTGVATVHDWIEGHGVGHEQEFDLAYSAGPFDVLEQRALEQVPEARNWPAARDSGPIARPVEGRWTGWRTG